MTALKHKVELQSILLHHEDGNSSIDKEWVGLRIPGRNITVGAVNAKYADYIVDTLNEKLEQTNQE